jgi:hypothetical protein
VSGNDAAKVLQQKMRQLRRVFRTARGQFFKGRLGANFTPRREHLLFLMDG